MPFAIATYFERTKGEEITMDKPEKAATIFQEGYNCAQAVIGAFALDCGIDEVTAKKMAAAFGGGIARTGETCGAVTGAMMAIGLRYGQTCGSDSERKEKTYEQVHEFLQRFQARNGLLRCKELLGCDVSTPEGRQQAKDGDYHNTRCPKFVRDSAEILESLLEEGRLRDSQN
ncbi:C-GCAxxG-C-C family protein [Heliomicrobium gestii]|nr:C-GCAxxG-C-C family protein [Heliomicrobium gestii]